MGDFISYYNQYKNKIFVYLLYRVNFDKELAEDLTSEVFLKALDNFNNFDESRSFQAWIYAIAHNHLVNYYRIANRVTNLDEDKYISKIDIDKVELTFELEQIFKVINMMEASDREVLLMRFVDQLSNTEIAELLDKEEGAIRTKMSRSLNKLRSLLNK